MNEQIDEVGYRVGVLAVAQEKSTDQIIKDINFSNLVLGLGFANILDVLYEDEIRKQNQEGTG